MESEKFLRRVTVIIPAFNEAETIRPIVALAVRHPLVKEVIVVDDGSSDDTAKYAAEEGAKTIKHRFCRGKAAAMESGVQKAQGEIFCFLDADIQGLTEKALTEIISPVISSRYDMFVGICGRKSDLANTLLEVSPVIGGQRALTRQVWSEVPRKYKENFQVEIALNYFTKKNERKMGFTILKNLTQVPKEKKRGFLAGLYQRFGMIKDLILISYRLYVVHSLKSVFIENS